MVSGRLSVMLAVPRVRKYRGLYCGLGSGVQELQERTDALGPGAFVVLGAFDALIAEIFAELPALLLQNVAELLDFLNDAGAFARSDVEPDAWALRDGSSCGESMDDTLIPPHRGRE